MKTRTPTCCSTGEIGVLDEKAYITLKALVLKSARDFQRLYDAVPDKDRSVLPERSTFYGIRTAYGPADV